MALRDLLDRLAIPILQAPMVGASPPEMALAVSRAGGMGSLAAGALVPDQIEPEVERLQALIDINRNIAGGLLAGAEHAAQAAAESAQAAARWALPSRDAS